MSKKTSKILIVSVVAILVVSMLSLVACGGMSSADLQKGFDASNKKSVHEDINISGINIAVGSFVTLAVNNVDISMDRKYEGGVLSIDAVISGLDVALGGSIDVLGIVSNALAGLDDKGNPKLDCNKDGTPDVFNLTKETIAALKTVTITAGVDIDPKGEDDYLVVRDFTIAGLNSLPTSDEEPLFFLFDGGQYDKDGNMTKAPERLPDPYTASELLTNINPRKEGVGLFDRMDFYSTNHKAGTILESFIANNMSMISLYDFDKLVVEKTDDKAVQKISFNDVANFNKVYDLGQQVLDEYADRELTEGKPNSKLGSLLPKVFGSDQVSEIVAKVCDMGKADMKGEIKKTDAGWVPTKMTTTQNITVKLGSDVLNGVINNVLPVFGLNLNELLGDMASIVEPALNLVLKDGLSTSVKAVTTSKFTY